MYALKLVSDECDHVFIFSCNQKKNDILVYKTVELLKLKSRSFNILLTLVQTTQSQIVLLLKGLQNKHSVSNNKILAYEKTYFEHTMVTCIICKEKLTFGTCSADMVLSGDIDIRAFTGAFSGAFS